MTNWSVCNSYIQKIFEVVQETVNWSNLVFFSQGKQNKFFAFSSGYDSPARNKLQLRTEAPLDCGASPFLVSLLQASLARPRGSAGKFRSPQQTHQASFDWFLPQFQARERTPYGGLVGFNRNSTPLYSRFWKDWICIFALLCGIIQSQLKSIKAVIWVLILWRGFLFV